MMEEAYELYQEFKTFLCDYLIRRLKHEVQPDDFDEQKTASLRPHLGKILPTLTLTEAMRLRVYFNDLLIYHLTAAMGSPTLPSPRLLSTTPSQPSSPIPAYEEYDEPPDAKKSRTESQTEAISGGLSSSLADIQQQTQTPLEDPIQRRNTVALMQSTPLSVPLVVAAEPGTLTDQQRLERAEADDFIADIISQLNLSPIPQVSAPQPPREINEVSSIPPEEFVSFIMAAQDEIPFLRGFTDMLQQMPSKRKKNKTRLAPPLEPTLVQPMKKKKRKHFEALCRFVPKQRTLEQIERAEESFLYFKLAPGRTRNMMKRIINNVVVPQGERGHIPMQRIVNLSNVMRAHASQRQSSIEQPGQVGLLSMLRSPCTPQALLRTSQLQPFTPIRAEVSGQSPGIEMDHISSFPTRSILRQQPLLTIPERDSSIPILLSPQLELEEVPPPIPIPHSPQLEEMINIPELTESTSMIPLNIGDDLASSSNLPRVIPEDIEMIEAQPQSAPSDNLVIPMQVDAIDSQVEVVAQNNSGLQVNAHGDGASLSWFEILRPREDIIYPEVVGERRRKRKRRRIPREDDVPVRPRRIIELPEIPDENNIRNFPELPDDFSQQVTQNPVENYSAEQESEFKRYFDLIKEAGKNPEYSTWEHFNPYLFSETDNFEMYTYIFKRMIKEDLVAMDNLYPEGTTRLEAAKGFRLILELQAMGLIEIESVGTRIISFKFKNV